MSNPSKLYQFDFGAAAAMTTIANDLISTRAPR
jgi:hypothetical protein